MPTPVETAEKRAASAITRLESSIGADVAFAFSPKDCQHLMTLIEVLRDDASPWNSGNLYERPCPVCGGRQPEDNADPCDVCDNLGMVATRTGQMILDMVERHYITNLTDDDISGKNFGELAEGEGGGS
jgi:hypothetical protein